MNQQESHNPESRALLENALDSIGCQYDEIPEGYLVAQFQGEKFLFDFDTTYLRIWDFSWLEFDTTDPSWPALQSAINQANYNFGPKVVYSSHDSDNSDTVLIHSVFDILFISAIPDIAEYLKSMLLLFFQLKETVRRRYHDILDDARKAPAQWPEAFENPFDE